MRFLPCALFLVLGACSSAPSLTDRCLDECDRSAANPACAPDGCRATCRDPAAVTCAAELDALLDCSELVSADALCGGSEPVCTAQNSALGSCITRSRSDAGSGSDAGL